MSNCESLRVNIESVRQVVDAPTLAALNVQLEKCRQSGPTPEPPPFLVRGVNFAGAMVRWAMTGFKMRDEQEIAKRMEICQSCINFKDNMCSLCGCACNSDEQVINKLALHGQSCPIGKWN